MTPTQQMAALKAANCEVAFDNLTRQLYATDASHYQIEPLAVAFPRDAAQASSIIQAAAQAGVSIIPRGAGTGRHDRKQFLRRARPALWNHGGPHRGTGNRARGRAGGPGGPGPVGAAAP